MESGRRSDGHVQCSVLRLYFMSLDAARLLRPLARSGPFAWQRLGAILLLLTMAVLASLPTLRSLLEEWSDTDHRTYTHGWLVVAVAVWLACKVTLRAHSAEWRFSPIALAPLFFLGIAAAVLQKAGIEIGHQLLLPVLIWTALLAASGWQAARSYLFPVGYLYFAIPIWTHFNEILQGMTIIAVRFLLRVTGIPAYFAGDQVEIPSGAFEIADGCSGLHFLIVALALAALYGELQNDRWKVRLQQLALASVLAIIGNWVRVYTIIIVGHLTDMQHYLITVDHYYFGWLVFAIAMTVFLVFAPSGNKGKSPETQSVPAAGAVAIRSIVFPALVLMCIPVATSLGGNAASLVSLPTPASKGPWEVMATVGERGWAPVFVGADVQRQTVYRSSDRELDLFQAAYATQRQGKELIGYENDVLAPLEGTAEGTARWRGISLNDSEVQDRAGGKWLIWSVYHVGSRHFTSGVAAQIWYGFHALGNIPVSGVLALRTRCGESCAPAREALGSFLDQAPELLGAAPASLP